MPIAQTKSPTEKSKYPHCWSVVSLWALVLIQTNDEVSMLALFRAGLGYISTAIAYK